MVYLFILGIQNVKKPRKSIWRTLFCCCVSSETESVSQGTNGACVSDETPPYHHINVPSQGPPHQLLAQVSHRDMHKKCMVIDLDETLVHSSFKVRKTLLIVFSLSFSNLN